MKQFLSLSLTFVVLGLSSAAFAKECGTLQVSSWNGQYDFVLLQNDFAQELIAKPALAQQLSQYNGREVCVDVDAQRDEYGAPMNIVTGFSLEN